MPRELKEIKINMQDFQKYWAEKSPDLLEILL